MDPLYTDALIETGTSLSVLAVKGTATLVGTKIRAMKNEKNVENIRTGYDEIINEILQEREEAIRIAQTYKSELERIEISDEDIEKLHNTISTILTIVVDIQLSKTNGGNPLEKAKIEAQVESYRQLEDLVSVDTLKTLQLLGFNFKAAIGQPLTEICANAIDSLGNVKKGANQPKKK